MQEIESLISCNITCQGVPFNCILCQPNSMETSCQCTLRWQCWHVPTGARGYE